MLQKGNNRRDEKKRKKKKKVVLIASKCSLVLIRILTANLSLSLYMHFSSGRFFRPPANPRSILVLISRRASAHLCKFLPLYIFTFLLWFLKAVFSNNRLLVEDGGDSQYKVADDFCLIFLSLQYLPVDKMHQDTVLSQYFSQPLFLTS